MGHGVGSDTISLDLISDRSGNWNHCRHSIVMQTRRWKAAAEATPRSRDEGGRGPGMLEQSQSVRIMTSYRKDRVAVERSTICGFQRSLCNS